MALLPLSLRYVLGTIKHQAIICDFEEEEEEEEEGEVGEEEEKEWSGRRIL